MSRCDSKALVILQIGAPAETKVYIFNVEAKLFNYAFDQTGHGELIQTHTHTHAPSFSIPLFMRLQFGVAVFCSPRVLLKMLLTASFTV